jgi:hypothetical protein
VDELETGRDLLHIAEGRSFDFRGVPLQPADAGPVKARLVGAEQEADRARVLDVDSL